MLDIKFIRQNKEVVQKAIQQKGVNLDLDKLLEIDERRREMMKVSETLKAEQNKRSKGHQAPEGINDLKVLKERIKEKEKDLKILEEEFDKLMLQIPNIPSEDTPVGKNESENKVIRQVGKVPQFNFKPKEHWELGESLELIDIIRAAKVSGARFSFIKGALVQLEFALVQYAISLLTDEKILKKIARESGLKISTKPFVPVIPPVMITPDAFQKMARLEPKEERYYIPSDDLYLIGSAEHTLGAMHMDETFKEEDLPIRYLGFSTAFRREAGSYGKDMKGILRVHQFDKLEIESFTLPDKSIEEQNFIVAIQEYLVKSLGLPYQVVAICTGDMGKPDTRQIDIETWMPGQNKYRETHTADLMTDYQARRLNTRFKTNGGELKFVHMNDATAFAGRTMIAIMENYQTEKGTIKIPKVLQKYMGGLKEIRPKQ